jgi:hypothetical protein
VSSIARGPTRRTHPPRKDKGQADRGTLPSPADVIADVHGKIFTNMGNIR